MHVFFFSVWEVISYFLYNASQQHDIHLSLVLLFSLWSLFFVVLKLKGFREVNVVISYFLILSSLHNSPSLPFLWCLSVCLYVSLRLCRVSGKYWIWLFLNTLIRLPSSRPYKKGGLFVVVLYYSFIARNFCIFCWLDNKPTRCYKEKVNTNLFMC